jgi:predicted nuclease of restriction endonuclease-like (RecB) superfamily
MTRAIVPDGKYIHALRDVVSMLEESRRAASRNINALMTATYWQIGRRIVEFEQGGADRAAYGQALLQRLSADLTARFGRGFGADNLELMRLFYQSYGDGEISEAAIRKYVAPLAVPNSESPIRNFPLEQLAQRFSLSWTHYVRLMRRTRSREERHFYEAEALRGGWSVRQLERQMDSQFYTRTLMSRNKRAMLVKGAVAQPDDAITPEQAIKDPCVLEFLNLKDEYSESDLEDALIHRLEDFLLELGGDFAFVGRQRRLRIGDSWFRVDLCFSIAGCAVWSSLI